MKMMDRVRNISLEGKLGTASGAARILDRINDMCIEYNTSPKDIILNSTNQLPGFIVEGIAWGAAIYIGFKALKSYFSD